MQVLKVFVIGMAAVIVIGTGVLAYGWTHHWNKNSVTPDVAPTVPADRVHAPLTDLDAGAAPFDVNVPLPDGMHFEQMEATGGRVLLRFSGPEGERIVVIDPRSGRVAGAIGIAPPGK